MFICLINTFNFFIHYGLLDYISARYTYSIVYVLQGLLYLEFCRYYLKKAGRLLNEGTKKPLLRFLNIFKIVMILLISANGLSYYYIPDDAYLCLYPFLWLFPIMVILQSTVFYFVFKWI